MTEAYVLRDPQGTVIGLSLTSYASALDEALREGHFTAMVYRVLESVCENEGSVAYRGYTLKREDVAL